MIPSISFRKPEQWALEPGLTEAREAWRFFEQSEIGPGAVWPMWEGSPASDGGGVNLAQNQVAFSPAGDLWSPGSIEWSLGFGGLGLRNPDSSQISADFLSARADWWHDSFTQHTAIAVASLESSNEVSKPSLLFSFGATRNGFGIGFGDVERKILFAVTNNDTKWQVESDKIGPPFGPIAVGAKYDKGDLKLFINGSLVAQRSDGPSSVGSHGINPKALGSTENAPFLEDGSERGWNGALEFLAATHYAIPDDWLRQLTTDPYSLIRPVEF